MYRFADGTPVPLSPPDPPGHWIEVDAAVLLAVLEGCRRYYAMVKLPEAEPPPAVRRERERTARGIDRGPRRR